MALDKIVDSAVLDAGMSAVADAIRAKGGTTSPLVWPEAFVSAIEGIAGAITVDGTTKTDSGVFDAGTGITANTQIATLSYQPDVVYMARLTTTGTDETQVVVNADADAFQPFRSTLLMGSSGTVSRITSTAEVTASTSGYLVVTADGFKFYASSTRKLVGTYLWIACKAD